MEAKTATAWRSGRPRKADIYCASNERNHSARRFWDGRQWSAPWYHDDPIENAVRAARMPAEGQEGVEWRKLHLASLPMTELDTMVGVLTAL